MLTDKKELKIDQDTFRYLNITTASLFNMKCYLDRSSHISFTILVKKPAFIGSEVSKQERLT